MKTNTKKTKSRKLKSKLKLPEKPLLPRLHEIAVWITATKFTPAVSAGDRDKVLTLARLILADKTLRTEQRRAFKTLVEFIAGLKSKSPEISLA
jgi:hypothetical protein